MNAKITGMVVLVFLGLAGSLAITAKNEKVNIQVTGKDRSTNQEGTSVYQVYTKNETFRMSDTLYYGKWNTADRYSKLQKGKSYSCLASGIRVPLLSIFRNLVDCKKM